MPALDTTITEGQIGHLTDHETIADFVNAAPATYAPKASPAFTGTVTIPGGGVFGTRTLNGKPNTYLFMGPADTIDNQINDTFISTIVPCYPAAVNTSGAGAGGIGFNIGNWVITATDGASALTRTSQWANIEHDYMQFQQSGGSAIFNDVVSSRFRFAIAKAGVTIVDNKGLDFVIPNIVDATGAVTNYIAINIPPMSGGGGTNFYGIKFNNAPNGGSIASAAGHDLVLNAINNFVRLRAAGVDILYTSAAGVGMTKSAIINEFYAAGVYSSQVASGNRAADEPKFWLHKDAVIDWTMRIQPGIGASTLEWLTGSNVRASLTAAGLLTATAGVDAGPGPILFGPAIRRKTFAFDAASSPNDVLQIKSEGQTGGWNGTIDLMVSRSAGTVNRALRVQEIAGGTAVGFYAATPVVRAAAITAPTAPGAAYVQAEAASMKTAVDAIRVALTNVGITL